MPWARFADDYLTHPKLSCLSTAAIVLDMASIIYSARELRDGCLTMTDVQTVAALIHLRRWQPAAAELVAARRWLKGDGGYAIHDYLDYQPARAEVLAERQQTHSNKVAAGRAGGVAAAKQKRSPVPGPGNNSVTTSSSSVSPSPAPREYAREMDPALLAEHHVMLERERRLTTTTTNSSRRDDQE